MVEHYDGDETDVSKLKSFILFAEGQMPENTGHKRMSTSEFNMIVANSQTYLKSINSNEFNYNSFTCGVALGMRLLLAPNNK